MRNVFAFSVYYCFKFMFQITFSTYITALLFHFSNSAERARFFWLFLGRETSGLGSFCGREEDGVEFFGVIVERGRRVEREVWEEKRATEGKYAGRNGCDSSVVRRRSFFFQRFDGALRITQGFGQETVLLLQEGDVPALSDDDVI